MASDLAKIASPKFEYGKKLLTSTQNKPLLELSEGRSIHSEYDYGSKRKFVDVLGNIKRDGQAKLLNLDRYTKG